MATYTINFGSTDFTRITPRIFSYREKEALIHYKKQIKDGNLIFIPKFYLGKNDTGKILYDIPTIAYRNRNGLVILDFRDRNVAQMYEKFSELGNIEYIHVTVGYQYPSVKDMLYPTNAIEPKKLGFGRGDLPALMHAILTYRLKSYLVSYKNPILTVVDYDDGWRFTVETADSPDYLEPATVCLLRDGTVFAEIDDENITLGKLSSA
jgi:hypothetical protein